MDIKIARYIGRGLCILLFILWGSFFIEHLSFFFMKTGEPPGASVWLLQLVHFSLLVSYLVCFKFERLGSVSLFVFALIFFLATAGDQALLFIVISVSPILFFGYGWMRNLWKGSPATS
jgi:hypothetical protein